MRNLKKVLSLSLALVMLLGMMVVGAGAAAFDDVADGADKQEAIEVMNAIEIIKGDGSGDFRPNDTLTRAEAAVIIAKVHFTPDTVKNMAGIETQFTDVAAFEGGWAVPYVQACANEKIINGDDATHFGPEREVNGVEFAAMLLRVLKVSVDESDPSTWAFNVWQAAHAAKLDANGVTVSTAKLSREDAAQMAFNAITEYSPSGSNGYVLMDGANLAAAYKDVVFETLNDAVLAKLASGSGANGWTIKPVTASDTLAATRFNLTPGNTGDAYGRTVKTWNVKGVKDPVYVSTESATDLVKVYTTAALPPVNVSKDLEDYTYASGLKYKENGVEKTAIANAGDIQALCRNGVTVEVYASGSEINSVIVIKKQIAKLAADPVFATNGNITISSLGMAGVKPENVDGDVSALAKGDVVLFVKDAKNVWHIERPDCITGTVSGNHSQKGALINGEYYLATDLTGKGGLIPYAQGSVTDDKEYNFYLDNAGFIAYAEAVSDGTAATSNYAVVLKTSWVKGTETGVIGETGAKGYLQAQILKTDGSTEVVTVASVNGFVPVAFPAGGSIATLAGTAGINGGTHYVKATSDFVAASDYEVGDSATINGSDTVANGDTIVFSSAATIAAGSIKGKYMIITDTATTEAARVPANNFYSYTVNSKGEYVLSTAAATGDTLDSVKNDTNNAGDAYEGAITTGAVKFDTENVGNANTVFLYAVTAGDKTEYKLYTGIANIPAVAAPNLKNDDDAMAANDENAQKDVVTNSAGVAKFVFIQTTGTTTASQDIVYITSKDKTQLNTNPLTYVYSALVNGEKKDITVDADLGDSAVKFYTVTNISDKDVYTLADASGSVKTGIKSTEGNTLVVADGTAYSYETGAPAWYYDGRDCVETTIEALSLDATDEILVTGAAGKAEVVYVIAKNSAPTAVTVSTAATAEVGIANSSSSNPSSGDMVLGTVTVSQKPSQYAAGKTITVTATPAAGTAVTVSIDNGEAAANSQTYTLAAGDAKNVTVTVTVTDDYSKAVDTYNYTLKLGAITADARAAAATIGDVVYPAGKSAIQKGNGSDKADITATITVTLADEGITAANKVTASSGNAAVTATVAGTITNTNQVVITLTSSSATAISDGVVITVNVAAVTTDDYKNVTATKTVQVGEAQT